MKASWIFTTNDVIANIGVIVAPVLMRLSSSPVPDLVVATVIAMMVLNGAFRIFDSLLNRRQTEGDLTLVAQSCMLEMC